MTQPSNSAKDIFLMALDVAPSGRAALMDAECGEDVALRRQVAALLKVHDEPDSLLDSPRIDVGVASVATSEDSRTIAERVGAQIGPYKLLQQIGEGGMGVVYMAEQTEPVERRVALKVIKPGMDTRKVIARFEAERQALAMMDHPNIAKVHDAGTADSGRPYFVMELVKGISITEYCDQHRLNPRERLELFVPVCQAVQHAHQKGIIHRDIKPSNVLVARYDDQPVPKVIDFGVAKAVDQRLTEKTIFTEFGQVVGTVEYMSPEQAELNQLDVDTRSDVYSLGVLLYELLTGEAPFDRERLRSAAFDEMLRIIREEEPPRPSLKLSTSASLPSIAANRHIEPKQLRTLVHGELDWIVMKALEKDRARRYDTASKFVEDVQHYLSDEAVTACPPSSAYRLRKFARRNKPMLATATAVAAAILIGAGVATWQAIRATQERDRATNERNRALAAEVKAVEEAERADREAENAETEATIATAVNDFLQQDILGLADAASQADAQISPDPDIKLRTALDRAAEKIGERFSDQPHVEAAIRSTIGNTYLAVGEYKKAEEHLRRAYELRLDTLGKEHPQTLAYRRNLAKVLNRQGRFDEAELLLSQTSKIQMRTLGAEHPDTLNSMNDLANTYRNRGLYEKAEKLHLETLESTRRTVGDEHARTLMSMYNVANVYLAQGRYDEAETLFRQVLQIRRRTLDEEHPDTLDCVNSLANVLRQQRRYDEAETLYRETLNAQQHTLGEEHPLTIGSMYNLALLYSDQARYSDAEVLNRRALEIRRRVLGEEHLHTAFAMNNLGAVLKEMGRTREAENVLRRSVNALSETLGPRHMETIGSALNLVNVISWTENDDDILMILEEAVAGLRETDSSSPDLAWTKEYSKKLSGNLSSAGWRLAVDTESEQPEVQLALRLARLAMELGAASANNWDNLGTVLYRNGKWVEAVEALEKAREMRDGNDRYHQIFLAMAYWQSGRYEEAVENYLQVAKWLARGPRAGEQYRFRDEAETLLESGTPNGMERVLEKLTEDIQKAPDSIALHAMRGRLYRKQQAWEKSAADWARAIELSSDGPNFNSPRKRRCRKIAEWPELFDLVAQLLPDEPAVRIGRGQYYALRSQWTEAASDHARAAPLQPIADQTYQYAGLLLIAGDEEGYRKFCGELTALAGETQDAFAAFVMARSCAIGPDSDVDPARVVEWAEQGVTENRNAWELHVLGLAQYRAGRFDEAIRSLEASNAGNWPALAKTQNDLVLALAHHRQGEFEKAGQLLRQATTTIDQARPQEADEPVDVAVPDWIGIETLRREAEGLIESPENTAEEAEHSESDELNED